MTDVNIEVGVADDESHMEITSGTTTADVKVAQRNALKIFILCFAVSAIRAVGNIPVVSTNACSSQKSSHGPFQYLISNAYDLVSFMSFEMGILMLLFSILLPRVPRIISMAKKLVWVAFVLVHLALGLKLTTHAACFSLAEYSFDLGASIVFSTSFSCPPS